MLNIIEIFDVDACLENICEIEEIDLTSNQLNFSSSTNQTVLATSG